MLVKRLCIGYMCQIAETLIGHIKSLDFEHPIRVLNFSMAKLHYPKVCLWYWLQISREKESWDDPLTNISIVKSYRSDETAETCPFNNKLDRSIKMSLIYFLYENDKALPKVCCFKIDTKALTFSAGSDCGSVGRAVATNTRGPRFESSQL